MKLILDTSILIDKFRGGHRWDTFLETVDRSAELYIPSIVVFELYSGESTKEGKTTNLIKDILSHFEPVDLTVEISMLAGHMYRDITKNLEVPDYIIAATALSLGGFLVTLNVKHFRQVTGVRIYQYG